MSDWWLLLVPMLLVLFWAVLGEGPMPWLYFQLTATREEKEARKNLRDPPEY